MIQHQGEGATLSSSVSRVRTSVEHEQYGRNIITSSELLPLRNELGVSRTAMAEILRLSPITYYHCEDNPQFGTRIWSGTAQRVGRMCWLTRITLNHLYEDNVDIRRLTPFHRLPVKTGWPQEVLLNWYRQGRIAAEDLGILGLWVHDDDLHLIAEVAAE